MRDRGELATMGEATVPVARFMADVVEKLDGQAPAAICGDRFRHAEFLEALRSAFADAITLVHPAGNHKLAAGRSTGRIDPVAATVLAVAQGVRTVAGWKPILTVKTPKMIVGGEARGGPVMLELRGRIS